MKRINQIISLWIILISILKSQVVPTPEWADYAGTAAFCEDIPATAGSVINVLDSDSVLCGSCMVDSDGLFGYIHVYGDDPNTVTDEGAETGDTLIFLLNGHRTAQDSLLPWTGNRTIFDNLHIVVSDNRAPQFRTQSLPDADENVLWETTISAEDPDGDSFIMEAVSLPGWISFEPDGRLHGTPGPNDVGSNILLSFHARDMYCGETEHNLTLNVNAEPADAVEEISMAQSPLLISNYPNPFNGVTTLRFTNPEQKELSLTLLTIQGKIIRHWVFPESDRSTTLLWDGTDASGRDAGSGVYICRLRSGNDTASHKLLIIK